MSSNFVEKMSLADSSIGESFHKRPLGASLVSHDPNVLIRMGGLRFALTLNHFLDDICLTLCCLKLVLDSYFTYPGN